MDRMVKLHFEKVKPLMKDLEFRNKCISLNFEEEAVEEWVRELTSTDKRYQGIKEFEWNETVTSEQKHVMRIRKLAEKEVQKKMKKVAVETEKVRRERQEARKQREAENAEYKLEQDQRR